VTVQDYIENIIDNYNKLPSTVGNSHSEINEPFSAHLHQVTVSAVLLFGMDQSQSTDASASNLVVNRHS